MLLNVFVFKFERSCKVWYCSWRYMTFCSPESEHLMMTSRFSGIDSARSPSFFVLLSMKGRRTWCKRLMRTICSSCEASSSSSSSIANGFENHVLKSASVSNTFGRRKLSRFHSSLTLFCSGVPVKITLRFDTYSLVRTWKSLESLFLSLHHKRVYVSNRFTI